MIQLKRLRTMFNIKSQKTMAELLGVPYSTYNYWENGKFEVDFENLRRISEKFDVSIDFLLGKTNNSAVSIPNTSESTTIPFISNEDKHVLELYHSLDDWSKRKFNTILESFAADNEDTTKKPGEKL